MKISNRIESIMANTNKVKLKYTPPVIIVLSSKFISGPGGTSPFDQPFGDIS